MRSCLIVKIEIGCEFGSTRGSLFSNGLPLGLPFVSCNTVCINVNMNSTSIQI